MKKQIIIDTIITAIFAAFSVFSLILGFSLKDSRDELLFFLILNGVLLGLVTVWRVTYVK